MMCTRVWVYRVGSSFPWTPLLATTTQTHTHTHFLLGDMWASAFCQGVFSCRSLGPLTWWESGLLTPQPTSPSSSLQMRRKTRPEESTAARPLLSSPVFSLLSQYFALVPFTSSLSSVIDNVNWLTESVVHWLWSLIKGLLIGTLFNTGPCNESCPLMLSWQQPFPVCQSFNVINYVTQLRRLFFSRIFLCPNSMRTVCGSWKAERQRAWELEQQLAIMGIKLCPL